MNQNVQPHSGAWVTFTYVSFSASAFMVAVGVFFLPLDLWIKGYLAMGIVMLVQSCVTLVKTVRDVTSSRRRAANGAAVNRAAWSVRAFVDHDVRPASSSARRMAPGSLRSKKSPVRPSTMVSR